jgi:hypothetical protein
MIFIASSLNNTIQCSDYWQRFKNYWLHISPYEIKLLQNPAMIKSLESQPGETTMGKRVKIHLRDLYERCVYDPISKTYVYSPEHVEYEPIKSNALYDFQQDNIELKNRIQKLEQNQRNILDLLLTIQSPIE